MCSEPAYPVTLHSANTDARTLVLSVLRGLDACARKARGVVTRQRPWMSCDEDSADLSRHVSAETRHDFQTFLVGQAKCERHYLVQMYRGPMACSVQPFPPRPDPDGCRLLLHGPDPGTAQREKGRSVRVAASDRAGRSAPLPGPSAQGRSSPASYICRQGCAACK